MMNVITGRHRYGKRRSVKDIDRFNGINDSTDKRDLKLLHDVNIMRSIAEKTSSSRNRGPKLNRCLYMLENLKKTGGLTPDDIAEFRKEAITNFGSMKNLNLRRMHELDEISQLIKAIPLTSRDTQYLAQFQYTINWYYCQIRFISDPAQRRRLFEDAKEKYRTMFKLLENLGDYEKLPSYLHWSQLCYEYAELIDEESLNWCKDAISSASAALSAPSSRNSTLSRSRDSTSSFDSLSSCSNSRRKKFIEETVELIRENILKIENIRYEYRCFERRQSEREMRRVI